MFVALLLLLILVVVWWRVGDVKEKPTLLFAGKIGGLIGHSPNLITQVKGICCDARRRPLLIDFPAGTEARLTLNLIPHGFGLWQVS